MTFEQLQKANEAIKPTDIGKGKDYAEVNQRIKAFRMIYPNGSIITTLVSINEGVCIFRAEAIDDAGKVLGTGTAYEKENSSFINKTSYIENCETSAVGRALAFCGIGIEASIASKEEVENAKLNQGKEKPKADKSTPKEEKAGNEANSASQSNVVEEARAKARVIGYINRHKMTKDDVAKLCKFYHIESLQDLTLDMANHYIAKVEKNGGSIDE